MAEENIVYVDDEGAISFRAIGHFFAKAWVRMLIWVVAAAVLTTIVVLPLKSFVATDRRATVQVELSYDGASRGQLPDGSAFNKDNFISSNIVSKAVASTGIEVDSIAELASCLMVSPAMTTEYIELREDAEAENATDEQKAALANYIPTKFDIKLDVKRAGLNDDSATKLIEAIVNEYRADFKTKYAQAETIDSSVYDKDMSNVEFAIALNMFEGTLSEANLMARRYAAIDSTYVSPNTNKMFNTLVADYQALITTVYDNMHNFIEGHNVWRNTDNALLEQKALLDNYTRQSVNIAALIEAQTMQLKEIEKTTTTVTGDGTTTIVTTYPPIYNTIATAINNNNEQLATYKLRIAECEAAIKRLNDQVEAGEADVIVADTMLASTAAASKAFISELNQTLADYNDREYSVTSIAVVAPAFISSGNLSFSTIMVYLVVCGVAVVVAMIISGVKIYNGKRKLEAQKAESQDDKPAEENK